MNKPKYLDDYASEYWKRHAPALSRAGILTERDVESFALLCQIWSLIRHEDCSTPQFIKLTQQYQLLAKQFALLPRERIKAGMEVVEKQEDEWGLTDA